MQIFISNMNLYWMNSMVRTETKIKILFSLFFTHCLLKAHFHFFVAMMSSGNFFFLQSLCKFL